MCNAWNINHRHGRGRYWPMIKRSSGRRQKYVSRFRSLRRTGDGQFLEHECESGMVAVNRNECHLAVRWDNHYFCTLLKSARFGRDSRLSLIKILVALCANFNTCCSDRSLSSIAVCSFRELLLKQLSRLSGGLCGPGLASSCGPLLRS